MMQTKLKKRFATFVENKKKEMRSVAYEIFFATSEKKLNTRNGMLPLIRFKEMLEACKAQIESDLGEMVAAAELVGGRPNYLMVDEGGYYHIQASGNIDEVVAVLEKQLSRVKRIKEQQEQ
jgi:hypothetical protein